ncbi:tRNA pseudouridine(55) synthase TruB [Sphingomonas sp. ID0503]|uniref:tRNA pseudouridine(55) synthase TruB n=1 Tax=Sphingomonas sp. ID0503 TaxID=3399691 RepID=UPI003AFAE008
MNGWIIIDKPVGPGSTDVVSKVKRALRAGGYPKMKVGHGGTLDPLASGVLPVALGEATKLAGRMLDSDKVYAFTVSFGVETDTLDAEGVAVETSDVRPTLAEVEAVLPRFTGPIEQVPPVYSALKVDGKRAYDRARAGETVEMKTRAVVVRSLGILPITDEEGDQPQAGGGAVRSTGCAGPSTSFAGPPPPASRGEDVESVTLTAHVSKGTYIRSLARDIARALGTVGHVTLLRRVKAGPFTLGVAISLDKLSELGHGAALEQALLPIEAGLDDIPALNLTPDQARLLRMGQVLAGIAAQPGLHLARDGAVPVALVEVTDREVRVVRGFNL